MEEIFCKLVPFFIKSTEREERKTSVRVQIGFNTNKHDARKNLIMKLTNDQDLYFLYTLLLAEEDFQSLKIQQGLLVDFTAFPQKVIDLLVMCVKEDEKENPKFILQFEEGGGSLPTCVMNIVETNPFRHLNHLSLKFFPGSDADIKSHLASCLKQLKDSYSLIQQKYTHTSNDLTGQLQEKEELLASKTAELDSMKQEWSSRLSGITSKHKEDLTLEKEKAVQYQSSLQVRFEKDRREMEQAHSKALRQLETRLGELEATNKDLIDSKYKSEAALRDYKNRFSVSEDENHRIKSELQTLRKDNASLDCVRLDLDKCSNALQTRVAVLEQETRDKAELLDKSNDLLVSEKEKKKRAEAEIEKRQKEISRLETKVKAMGDELKKGNEIIKKLQGEIKSYHAKVKLRSQIATEQEKLLSEKDQELEKLRQELAGTKDTLRITEDKNEKLSANLESATQKLEESKKLLKTNENMIQWLNKQINEQRVMHTQQGTFEIPNSHTRPTFTAIHNYSTSSHGSVIPQDSLQTQTHYTNQRLAQSGSSQHQVHYQQPNESASSQPAFTRLNGVSVPSSQPGQSNVTTGPAEQMDLNAGKKKLPIDPKFLTKREEAIPVRDSLIQAPSYSKSSRIPTPAASSSSVPLVTNSTSVSAGNPVSAAGVRITPSAHSNIHPLPPFQSVRLSQEMIVPKSQPPLASAYFPNHS